ncbi:MAG: methionyl-tRNA formyltransferase [Verrucomicrobiae bacterium]|nr:methionyl-tRNA formyltransferase [Verrucomicrobiae bacterium]
MKAVFFGSADFACPALRALVEHPSFDVVGVVTQPDRPRGRHEKLAPTPVKLLALRLHCKVLQPASLQSPPFLSQLRYLRPDVNVVAAYGKILPRDVLHTPRFGSLNIHGSLLPKFRGAAPIQRAIMEGCDETGVTIMRMDEGLDTGDLLLRQSTHIRDADTVATLHDRLAAMGASLLIDALRLLAQGKAEFRPQAEGEATHAPKITRDDEWIEWETSKRRVWNHIRALTPGPGACSWLITEKGPKMVKLLAADFERFVHGKPGEILKVDGDGIHVAAPRGAVIVKELQAVGKRRMLAAEFLRGCPLKPGQMFVSRLPEARAAEVFPEEETSEE